MPRSTQAVARPARKRAGVAASADADAPATELPRPGAKGGGSLPAPSRSPGTEKAPRASRADRSAPAFPPALATPAAARQAVQQSRDAARMELANRLFFRLYQCANLLHKTGSRAVESEGLTTQQWAVLGALSRPESEGGMGVNELARYLMVSRQNLSGLLGRMERDGHICAEADERDRRSRLIRMTEHGRHVWQVQALPKIGAYYEQALDEFSLGDITHALHYLLRLLDNMQRLDQGLDEDAPAA